MEGLAVSGKTYPLTSPATWRRVKTTPKWRFWGKITPLSEHVQNSSIKVQYSTSVHVFPECHADLSVTKKHEFIVPVTKNHSLLAIILRPFGLRRENFDA